MLALAIDTSGDLAGITLARDDSLVAEHTFRHKMDLLRRLMPEIDRMFTGTGTDKSAIDVVVVSTGPGSFTGLRIGVATAKSIAFALGKPIVGIPTLEVLAAAFDGCSSLIVPMIHARPGEVYNAIFKAHGGRVKRLTEDRALEIRSLISEIRSHSTEKVLFCGDGALRNRSVIEEELPEASVFSRWSDHPDGYILARLGLDRLQNDDIDDPVSLVPHYVKRSTPEIRAEQQISR